MHKVRGYPVKSTWIKAVQAGNYIECPLLTYHNVKKYYQETTETEKGHMNQSHKNVWSTKTNTVPFEECNTKTLQGKKQRDFYTNVYDVRENIFSNKTGQFPMRSRLGNKYIMVMVKIDSSEILVETMKIRNYE